VVDEEHLHGRIQECEIVHTDHFERKRLPNRSKLSKEIIEEYLFGDWDELVDSSHQRDDHHRDKYSLLFDKSNRYLLKTVVSLGEERVFLVTSHVVAKRRLEQ
jgi:hypothetical protein